MPGDSGVTVVTTLVCSFYFACETAGAIGRPAFPAPSFPRGLQSSGAPASREQVALTHRLGCVNLGQKQQQKPEAAMLRAEDNRFLTESGAGTAMGELLRRFWLPVVVSKELPEDDAPPK